MKKSLLLLLIGLLAALIYPCHVFGAQKTHPEKAYQKLWCDAQNGKQEVILFDKARVDCVTQTHAIEFDFANKWGEAIGQALYYGAVTKKKPGIVLIMEDPVKDQRYLERIKTVAGLYGITVWTMSSLDKKQSFCCVYE